MKRKRKISLTIWIVFFLIICALPEAFSQGISETTIRNVTKKTLRYSIKPVNSDKQPIKKKLTRERSTDFWNFLTLM